MIQVGERRVAEVAWLCQQTPVRDFGTARLDRLEVPMRSIYELTTEEAYRIVAEHFGHDLPPLDAVENEDWGRDYVLQHFRQHTAQQLA